LLISSPWLVYLLPHDCPHVQAVFFKLSFIQEPTERII
jgi:hypothetical protein